MTKTYSPQVLEEIARRYPGETVPASVADAVEKLVNEREQHEAAGDNPYPQPYSPEHRVVEAARLDHGLTDEQVLQATKWVPNDGTLLRDELIALYR